MEKASQEDNTLLHISHLHPLHLTDPAGDVPPTCHACRLPCAGSAYECAPCHYTLHPACARFERTMRHPAHPAHPLALRLAPPYQTGAFSCNACRQPGATFVFHCAHCQFDLHLPCAALPDAVTAPSHPHPLKLTHEDPFKDTDPFGVSVCAACNKGCSRAQWFYMCKKCSFGGHVGCFVPSTPAKDLYMAVDIERLRAEAARAEAAKTAALLQQYQQLSSLIGMQSNLFASNIASMGLAGASSASALVRNMANDNLEINFNKSADEQTVRKREEFYAQRRKY